MRLRILDDIVAMIARVHGLAQRIGRHDADLARQMKRASTSVGLNAGEAVHGRGGNRSARLYDAMGSGRETILALRIASACDYLDEKVASEEIDHIDQIVAVLYRLANPKR